MPIPRRRAWILSLTIASLAYLAAAAFGTVPGMQRYFDRNVTRDITGCTAVLGDAELTFALPRTSSGNSYTLARYALPRELAACFDRPPARSAGPGDRRDDRSEWDGLSWRTAPLAGRDSAILRWAMGDVDQGIVAEARAALTRPTSLYAIRFAEDGSFPKSTQYVELFVVDPPAGRIYHLYLNM
jgi:hypothetical protein